MSIFVAVIVVLFSACFAVAITGALLLLMFGDVIAAKLGKSDKPR
jgi:hypothetical protein